MAIVTGAGSVGPGWGNGKATAVLFAREGAKVLAVDINLWAMPGTLLMQLYILPRMRPNMSRVPKSLLMVESLANSLDDKYSYFTNIKINGGDFYAY